MDKKKTLIIIIALVVVTALVWIGARNKIPNSVSRVANEPVGTKTDFGMVTKSGIVAATGTSPIASSGIVMTPIGRPVQNNVQPAAPTAPQQSDPIARPSDIPTRAIKLNVSAANGFVPNAFTASAGEVITIAVLGGDNLVHVFAFQDPSLSAVAIGVGPNETRAITFNAPTKSGDYKFYSNVPGQGNETGIMTIR